MSNEPLTAKELAFRKLTEGVELRGRIEVRAEYSKLCAEARERWESENLVWFYGVNEKGGSTWGRRRPNPELEARLRSTGQFRWKRRDLFLAELEKAKRKANK